MAEEEEDQDLEIATRDFSKLEDVHMNAGFREGVISGKDESVQKGFNEGFVQGVECALQTAVVRGKISALQAYCTSQGRAGGDKLAVLLEEAEGRAEEWAKTVRDGQLQQFRRNVEQCGLKQLIHSDPSNQPTVEAILNSSHLPPPVAELESRLETVKMHMEIGRV